MRTSLERLRSRAQAVALRHSDQCGVIVGSPRARVAVLLAARVRCSRRAQVAVDGATDGAQEDASAQTEAVAPLPAWSDNTCGATTTTCAGGDDDGDDGLVAADDVVEGDGDGALGEEEMAALLARLNVRF